MKKQNYKSNIVQRRTSMISEKLLTRIGNYLIAVTLIMLVGLLYKKELLHGFPIPWLLNMRYPDYGRFITSIIICAVIVVGCDILSRMIILAKEPKLKIHTKSPYEFSEHIEDTEYNDDSEEAISDVDTMIDKDMVKEARKRLINHAKEIQASKEGRKNNETKPSPFIIFILVAAFIILSIVGAIEDDVDFIDDWDEDDIVLDADEDFNTAENAVHHQSELLFDLIQDRDYDYFDNMHYDNTGEYDNAGTEFLDIASWDSISYDEIYSYIHDSENYALQKYIVTDDDGVEYILAVYMDIGGSSTDGYEASVSGVALIASDDYYSGISKVSNPNNISEEEYEEYFMDNIINVGTISVDKKHILLYGEAPDMSYVSS